MSIATTYKYVIKTTCRNCGDTEAFFSDTTLTVGEIWKGNICQPGMCYNTSFEIVEKIEVDN